MIDFTNWKYYKDENENNIGITFVFENGTQSSILLTDPNVTKWLAEGNEPLPADE